LRTYLIVCNLFCNCNTFSLLDIIILNRVILFETRCTKDLKFFHKSSHSLEHLNTKNLESLYHLDEDIKCCYRTMPETVSISTSASGLLTDTRLQLGRLELLGKERVTQLVQMLVQVLMVICTHAIEVILLMQGRRVMYLVGSAATESQTCKSSAKNVSLSILRHLASGSCRFRSRSGPQITKQKG